MNSKSAWRALAAPSMLGTLVFFLGLWLLDFPKPSYDDLFQSGASLNLAAGGDYSNPLIGRQGFPSHYFFMYPPLHSYALAGWLKLFGISSLSVTAYAIFSCVIISLATIVILRRHGASAWLEWCVPLGVGYVFLGLGLRAELPAVALIMAGYALVDAEGSGKKPWVQLAAFTLIFLGASAAPRVTLYAAALALRAGWRAWTGAANARERWILLAVCGGAMLIAGLTFLWLIDFRLGEFVHTFRFHAAGRIYKSKLKMIYDYLFLYLGYIQMSLILLPLGLLLWALRKPKDELSLTAMFIVAAVPLVVWTGGIGSATAWWAILVMLLLAGSLLKGLARPRAIALQTAIVLVLLIVNRRNFAECWGIVTGKIQPDRGEELAAAAKLQPTPEHPLLVDGWVARYVYDYRLPNGVLDLEWSTPFPGAFPGSYVLPEGSGPQLRNGDIFVIGNYLRGCLVQKTFLEATNAPTWTLFGLRKLTFDKYPGHVFIVPAESCKGIRPGVSTLPTGG